MSDCHSIWLMPSPENLAVFEEIVARLAAAFATPVFRPHLTLVEDMPRSATDLAGVLDRHFTGQAAFTAPIRQVAGLPLFFRSLFAQFAPAGRLLELKALAVAGFGTGDVESFMPHISLAYGVAEERKEPAIAALGRDLSGRSVTFDSIVVAASGQAIPIEDWAIVHRHPLLSR